MVDQQELEHAGARGDDVGRARRDDHAVGAHRRARRLQLRHLLDFHDAHAARTVDADAWVIAVVRHRDAALDRGLQDGLALLDRDLAAIDRQRNGVHALQYSDRFTAGWSVTAYINNRPDSGHATVTRYWVGDPVVIPLITLDTPADRRRVEALGFRAFAPSSIDAIVSPARPSSRACSSTRAIIGRMRGRPIALVNRGASLGHQVTG
jgi:hypothetical protein